MNLYQVNNLIENCFDSETGEVLNEDLEKLLNEKHELVLDTACHIKNLEAFSSAIKTEIDALNVRRTAINNKIEAGKLVLTAVLNGEKISDQRVEIGWRRSTSVKVLSETELPEEFLRVKTTIEPDKIRLKKALEDQDTRLFGKAELLNSINIQIK